jgi:hypothetical protein
MSEPNEHDNECPRNPVHGFRAAVEACNRLTSRAETEVPPADRLAAASLLNGLQYFANHGGWANVTLANLAEYTALHDDTAPTSCNCKGSSTIRW